MVLTLKSTETKTSKHTILIHCEKNYDGNVHRVFTIGVLNQTGKGLRKTLSWILKDEVSSLNRKLVRTRILGRDMYKGMEL